MVDDFAQWIGRRETAVDDMSRATVERAGALFDQRVGDESELPPLWHWFYFLPNTVQGELGDDGHPQRCPDGFMPPIPYSRRMFAGARIRWMRPLVVGRPARREAEIRDVVLKRGRSGPLAFVTVGYRYWQGSGGPPSAEGESGDALCLEEEQTIVYREPGPALQPPQVVSWPDPPEGAWTRTVVPDARLLFRFSALTFNAHRIHYDRPYALEEEGYPGLVVHGPLTAMLLLQLARSQVSRSAMTFQFRSEAPLFDLAPIRLVAWEQEEAIALHAEGPDGRTAMVATVAFHDRSQ